MINIIVPTDFSDNANNALDYAIDIVNHIGGRIVLYHTYQVKSTAGMFISIEKYLRGDAEEEITRIIKRVNPKLKKRASIEGKVARGNTESLIADVADKAHYDLIVMGTQGASGLKEIFIGSTAAGIIGATHTPVLAIPSDFKYRPIKNIVLAVDSKPLSNGEVSKTLRQLVKAYKAKVSVFQLIKEPAGMEIDPSVSIFLDDIQYDTFQFARTDGLNNGINEFVAQSNADMLCMIRHERSFLNNVFHVSVTRKEVFDSPVPLLVLHD